MSQHDRGDATLVVLIVCNLHTNTWPISLSAFINYRQFVSAVYWFYKGERGVGGRRELLGPHFNWTPIYSCDVRSFRKSDFIEFVLCEPAISVDYRACHRQTLGDGRGKGR